MICASCLPNLSKNFLTSLRLSPLSPYPLFPSLSGCKDTTTFSTTKYFFNFFLLFLSTTPSHPDYQYLKCLILFCVVINIFNFTIFLPLDPWIYLSFYTSQFHFLTWNQTCHIALFAIIQYMKILQIIFFYFYAKFYLESIWALKKPK